MVVLNAISRRLLLRVTALGAMVGVTSSAVGAQENGIEVEEIELGGRESAWEGRAPDEIEGEGNPTLQLVEGETYTVTWENEDGLPHNFVVVDEDDSELVETEIIGGRGRTQTVEFTADPAMTEYFCRPHRSTMQGDIEVVGNGSEAGGETTEEFAVEVDELFELEFDDSWRGVHPEAIADEANPTLELTAGNVYVVYFTAAIGTDENDTGDTDEESGGANEGDTDEASTEDGNNLVIVDENDEAIVSTASLQSGESGAVTFVATDGIVGYRDETTQEEGEIVVSGEDADSDSEGTEPESEGGETVDSDQ